MSSSFASATVDEELAVEQQTTFKSQSKTHVSVSTFRTERSYEFASDRTELNANATEVLDNKDYVGFFKACGPGYISEIRRAQEIVAIFKFNSYSSELATEFSAELEHETKPEEHPWAVDGICENPAFRIDKDGRCCSKTHLAKTGRMIELGTTNITALGYSRPGDSRRLIEEDPALQGPIEEDLIVDDLDTMDLDTMYNGTVSRRLNLPSAPYTIKTYLSGRRYCITLMRGNVAADLMTWTCHEEFAKQKRKSNINKKWQRWYWGQDGRIRSAVDPNYCLSLGKNARERNKPKLERCSDENYQVWASDSQGRIQNRDNNLFIGVSSGCFRGVVGDGNVLEAQRLHTERDGHICPKFPEQFWRLGGGPLPPPPTKAPTNAPTKGPTKGPTRQPAGTPTKAPTRGPTKAPTKAPTREPDAPTNSPTYAPQPLPPTKPEPIYVPEYVCTPFDPPASKKVSSSAYSASKFSSLSKSLVIKIQGYGIGLNQYGSMTLVATTIEEFKGILNFAIAHTQRVDPVSYDIGLVYGLMVTPWADNTSFLEATKLNATTIELPINNTLEVLSPAPCTDDTHVVDKLNYCCHPDNLYDAMSLEYAILDVALGKTTSQSSTEDDDPVTFASLNVVDGSTDTEFKSNSETSPYWNVDLGGKFELKKIVIHPGMSDNLEFEVVIFNNNGSILRNSIALTSNVEFVMDIENQIVGDKVEIRLHGTGALNLFGVQVFGMKSSTPIEIKNDRGNNLCMTVARGNVHSTVNQIILWKCGEVKSSRWQQWYYGSDESIRSGLDRNKCLDLGIDATTRNTFFLSDCGDQDHQKWVVDDDGRIMNKMHRHYIGVSAGCTLGSTSGSVLEAQVRYDGTSGLCDKFDSQFWSLTGKNLICRPTEVLQTDVVKITLATNAEYISRLDMAIRQKLAQIAQLQHCISATRYIPSKHDFDILRSHTSLGYGIAEETDFTLIELKKAIDPFNDYGLLKHLSKELDEYLDKFVSPCLAALYGSSDLTTNNQVDNDFFLKTTWDEHAVCSDFTCLEEDKRWGRKASGAGCVNGLMTGLDAEAYDSADESNCSLTVNSEGNEECKYVSSVLSQFQEDADKCWTHLPHKSISYLMYQFCTPMMTSQTLSSTSTLSTNLSTDCPASTSPYRRRFMLRKRRRKKRHRYKYRK